VSDRGLSRPAPRELEGRELEGRELEGVVMRTLVAHPVARVLRSLVDLLPAIDEKEHLKNGPRVRQELALRGAEGLAPRELEVAAPRHLAVVDVHVSHKIAHCQPSPFVSFASLVVKIDYLRRL
jgi:hypothetical protein